MKKDSSNQNANTPPLNQTHGSAPFPIGTIFMSGGKHPRRCVVRDILTTRNLAGEIVRIRYVADHDFAGQVMRDPDVSPVTIARSFVSRPNDKNGNSDPLKTQ